MSTLIDELSDEKVAEKRQHSETVDSADDENDDGWIGPMPSEAVKPKKRKFLQYEEIYLKNLPRSEMYEKSYMHRDVVSHLVVTRTDFIITASADGHVKFWKKNEGIGIEFVKHFRSHLGTIVDLAASPEGHLCCTISDDKNLKVFEVRFSDMINMFRLGFVPLCCSWVYSPGDPISAVAVSEKETGTIHIYDGRGSNEPLHIIDKLHYKPVIMIRYNRVYHTAISVDQSGMLEYWSGIQTECKFPKNVLWQYKTDTDLYQFAQNKTVPTGLAFSPNGKLFATIAKDRKVRVFRFHTGKLTKVIEESLKDFSELQQTKQQLPNMEFGRRMAVERDLEKSDQFKYCNIVFDESGNFIFYATMLGIKVINLYTNQCSRTLGKSENARFLHLALFQGTAKKPKATVTLEMAASDNPALKPDPGDPTLYCTAFKKPRFYMFSRRGPDDLTSNGERDVFNEKPTKEEMVAATQDSSYTRISENVTIHTTMGDLTLKLFAKECPKTVENFCVHGKNGFFNGHIFHRVIKGFMIQTGDPLGNGTGGESIWGGEFEDEFVPSLRHDRPYTVSMANAGPNTNGSQFFITVVPTPWLDNKHTVFGRVVKGMEIAQNIGNCKTNPKTDKPYDEIRIVSLTIK